MTETSSLLTSDLVVRNASNSAVNTTGQMMECPVICLITVYAFPPSMLPSCSMNFEVGPMPTIFDVQILLAGLR